MKCKNCGNETENNNVYCSLKCRNIYVNKYLRDYSKLRKTNDKKRKNLINNYYENVKKCKNCGKNIEFEKRRNNFCCGSCSTTFTNKNRTVSSHVLSEKGYENIKKANRKIAKEKFYEKKVKYYSNKKRCENCNKIISYVDRKMIFCDNKCKKEYYIREKDNFYLYKKLTKFKFNLNNFSDNFDFTLIERYGWYKAKNNGDNMDGVSRDHMFSIKEGFRKMINPLILSHPSNCKLIINRKNQSKSDGCSIIIERLLLNIKQFDNKYGKYYDFELETYIDLEKLKDIYMQL